MTPVSVPPDPYQRALKDLREAREQLRVANERIKRLEEAGDDLLSHSNSTDYHAKVKAWHKAKEAKL